MKISFNLLHVLLFQMIINSCANTNSPSFSVQSTASTPEKNHFYIHTSDGEYEILQAKPPKQSPKETPHVTGFIFPITEQEEVERLENTVSQNVKIRQEYVLRMRVMNCSTRLLIPSIITDILLEPEKTAGNVNCSVPASHLLG